MNVTNPDPFPFPDDGLDQSVREVLDSEAKSIDGHALWAGALARLEQAEQQVDPVRTSHRWRHWFAAASVMAVAASILFVAILLPPTSLATANPAELVASAKTVHNDGADRCYRLTFAGPAPLLESYEKAFGEPQLLFTRGDRFYQNLPTRQGAWGRDEQGRVWIAFDKQTAARFEPAELPQRIREMASIRGLELGSLLDQVLADYTIEWSSGVGDTRTIIAVPRTLAKPLQIARAEIHIHPVTKEVENLTLFRKLPKEESLRVTYTLIPCDPQPDPLYTAEGQLHPKASVYGTDRPVLRRRLLVQQLGEAILGGS